eukprot:s4909_g4.t1
MRSMNADLKSLVQQAGIDDAILDYLQARGIPSVGILSAIGTSYDEVDNELVKPLIEGVEINGKKFEANAEQQAVTRASIRFLWKSCSDSQTTTTTTTTTETTTTPTTKTAPKEIPPDTLRTLAEEYESQKIKERRRVFPMKHLLGSEKIMARVWYEHHNSKQYTPLQLHEVIETRHFDASGNVNQLSQTVKQEQPTRLTVDTDNNTLILEDESHWSPKGILSVLDSLVTVQWTWVLCQLGHEIDIEEYIAWWAQLFRSKNGKLEQLKAYWLEASWRVSLAMRNGTTFQAATKDVMNDQFQLQAALAKDVPMPKTKPAPKASAPAPRQTQTWNRNTQPSRPAKRWQSQHQQWGSNKNWRGDSYDPSRTQWNQPQKQPRASAAGGATQTG